MSNNPYYEQDTQFIIGFAGSGKSTKIAEQASSTTLMLVPTHKAAEVLRDKGIDNVYTIHSVLKLVPSINENFKKRMTTKLTRIGSTDLSTIKKIVIDEFSMINEDILNILMEALPADAHVTIVGDPYQLPPVSGTPINPWEPIEELTTQHRSKNPEGTKLFMDFMKAIRDYRHSPILSTDREANWVKMFNPDTDRILAFTNKRVVELNNMVVGERTFDTGDDLSMNGIPAVYVDSTAGRVRIYPTCMSKGKLMPPKKLVKMANDTTASIEKWHTNLGMYNQTNIIVDDVQYLIYYDPNHYATEMRLKKDVEKYQKLVIHENKLPLTENIPTWCRSNRGAPYVMERGKAWSKYLAHKNYVFNLAYPFATTIHKAQGSEFSKVFIDHADIMIANNINTEQYQRLMYVALSRSIDEIIFI